MQINLTKEEYKKVIELVVAGRTLLNDYEKVIDGESQYEDISNLLCSKAKEFDAEDIVAYNEENGKYEPTDELALEVLKDSEEYLDEMFWDTLIYELTLSELERKGLEDSEENMDMIWDKLVKEFEQNGLNRLTLPLEDINGSDV